MAATSLLSSLTTSASASGLMPASSSWTLILRVSSSRPVLSKSEISFTAERQNHTYHRPIDNTVWLHLLFIASLTSASRSGDAEMLSFILADDLFSFLEAIFELWDRDERERWLTTFAYYEKAGKFKILIPQEQHYFKILINPSGTSTVRVQRPRPPSTNFSAQHLSFIHYDLGCQPSGMSVFRGSIAEYPGVVVDNFTNCERGRAFFLSHCHKGTYKLTLISVKISRICSLCPYPCLALLDHMTGLGSPAIYNTLLRRCVNFAFLWFI